jgi:hypothetical protein
MERVDEETTQAQESARGSTPPAGQLDAQRSQEARQQGERPQGRPGQKPQEDPRRPAQRPASSTGSPQEDLSALISAIRARFGYPAIGLGTGGIRSPAPALR